MPTTLTEQEIRPQELRVAQARAFERDVRRLQAHRDEFVEVACPACGSSEGSFVFEKYTFAYTSCAACETLYMNPRPSESLLASYYAGSENYRFWAQHTYPASEPARREKIHKPWLARVLGYCREHAVPTGTLLEVGPGFGTFSAVAAESGAFERVVAVEPTPEMAQACRDRRVEVIEKRVEEITDEIDDADVVVAFEVIEHLFAPRPVIERVASLLRPGGLLVLSCPNGQGFDVALLGALSMAIDAEHVNLFNPWSLSRLVESCGFEVLSVTTPGRLDAELVRKAVLEEAFDVSRQPFLQRVLIDEWDRLGGPFQDFIAEQGLSSHMWMAARRV